MSTAPGQVLLFGPNGVVGSAIADQLSGSAEWRLTTASRRGVTSRLDGGGATGRVPDRHISVDLLDAAAARAVFGDLTQVTHVVFAAYLERPTMAETTGPNLAMLTNALDALRAARAPLQRVVLIGGGKSYGEHLGPYKTPAKESDPRFLGPIFYNDQEDLLADRARTDGFTWSVLRPDAVIGFSPSPMTRSPPGRSRTASGTPGSTWSRARSRSAKQGSLTASIPTTASSSTSRACAG